MKKWLIFGGGVLTGVILTIAFAVIFAANRSQENNGVTWFDQPGDIVPEKSFKVFQVLEKSAALVNGNSEYGDLYMGTVYLLTNDEGKYYYDDEIVEVPDGKVARQVGIYKYPTKNEIEKTVQIVKIMNK